MSPAKTRLLIQAAAIGALSAGAAGPAFAAEASLVGGADLTTAVKVEVIDSSRLACGESATISTLTPDGTQCAFDSAARGARMVAEQDIGKASIETYATLVHASIGPFTPDQLLASPEARSSEVTDLFLIGLKGRLLDDRLKFKTEFVSTRRLVEDLLNRDWMLAGSSAERGTSAMLRLDARFTDSPGFSWSATAEMQSVSDDYDVGRADGLSRYAAMPGSRLSFSSKARVGQIGLMAGADRLSTPYGNYDVFRGGFDLYGVSVRIVSRDGQVRPAEGSSLVASSTHTTGLYLDLDSNMLAMSLLPHLGEVPFLVPSLVSLSFRSGETESRYADSAERFERTSFGIDGTWETPVGETMLSYWRDSRKSLTGGSESWANEMMQVSHFVRRGNWRFGVDASLVRGGSKGSAGSEERSWSLGQSVAYSAPDGPEFRLALGQDRGVMRLRDDSFLSADSYSQVMASLDLSQYMQERFERPDLRLTLDYRRSLERSDLETSLSEEVIDRWADDYRRQGFLISFGMKL